MIVYWEEKSAVAAVLVTCAVPDPVSVPAPETITAAAGVKIAPALIFKLPATLKLVFALIAAEVLVIVNALNEVAELPLIVWAAAPLNVTVPELCVNVPLFVQLPPMFKAGGADNMAPASIITLPPQVKLEVDKFRDALSSRCQFPPAP